MRSLSALLALIVLLAIVSGCYSARTPDGPIKSFTADRDKITKGQATKIKPVFDGGIGTIDHDIGEVQSGQAIDTPVLNETTKYTLTVTNDAGQVTSATLEIKAFDPAKIISFNADKVVRPGESTSMTPIFEGVRGEVDQGVGEVKSGVSFPTGVLPETKIYILKVFNEAGDPVTAEGEAEAAITPVITSFDAPGPTVGRYAPTSLTAVFKGGHGLIDNDVGPIKSGASVQTKDVPVNGVTWTLTVTNGLGESVKKSVSVTTKKEMFATNYDGDILVFDFDASGDPKPKRKILTRTGKNQGSGITGLLGIVVTADSIFVANENGTPSISVFGIADKDDATPTRRLSGGAGWVAEQTGPYLISMSGTELFVPDKSNRIEVWNTTDTGAVAPKRTIEGNNTGLNNCFGTWVDNGELYVTNNANGGGGQNVTVYPVGSSGNQQPSRTFPLSVTIPSGVLVSGNELFVCSEDAVTVLNKNSGAQVRQIKGAQTRLAAQAVQCSISDGELFYSSDINNEVVVFPVTADGNVAPKRKVGGPNTGLEANGTVVVF